jgi:hypothetical protein
MKKINQMDIPTEMSVSLLIEADTVLLPTNSKSGLMLKAF